MFVLAGCSTGSSSAVASAPALDDLGGRMDVHPSVASSSEPSVESGPEPGETFASPPAASIPPGTRVPDIRQMDFEDAVISLRRLGMDFGFTIARTNHAAPWTVLEQTPAPGDTPTADGRVSMVVSMGPRAAGVAVVGGVACKPEEDDIDEPYCDGKILRY
jgi:hypothetical protein